MAVEEQTPAPQKTGSAAALAISFAILTVLALGAGWLLDIFVLEAANPPPAVAHDKAGKTGADTAIAETGAKPKKITIGLAPIIVDLRSEEEIWMRIELILVADPESQLQEAVTKSQITADITALLRTLTPDQISGPSGFLHLKEDLLDRARLSSDGKVDDVLIVTLVVE